MKKQWNTRYKGFAKADKAKIGTIPDFKENRRFTGIYDELKDICEFIDANKKSELTQSLKNYVLIRLVNVAESQLQTITARKNIKNQPLVFGVWRLAHPTIGSSTSAGIF